MVSMTPKNWGLARLAVHYPGTPGADLQPFAHTYGTMLLCYCTTLLLWVSTVAVDEPEDMGYGDAPHLESGDQAHGGGVPYYYVMIQGGSSMHKPAGVRGTRYTRYLMALLEYCTASVEHIPDADGS